LASQLRFEGAVLEDLLDRVRTEVGPDARIVAANRIRKGGVGGFFAREGFEVIVDLADGGGQTPPRSGGGRSRRQARVPASVLEIADDVNGTDREQVIDLSEVFNGPAAAPVSTESSDFGSMLAALSRDLDEDEIQVMEAPAPPPQPAPAPPPAAEAAPVVEPPVSPQAHYRRVTAPAPQPAPAAPTPPPAAVLVPEPAPAPMQPMQPMPEPVPDARLRALGLPGELIPSAAASSDLRTALFHRLSQLPPPPMLPRTAGVIIAVVGIGTAPIALARRLADELETDPDHIVLATPEPMSELSHPDDAETSRLSWRRREEPTIVACSIGPGRAQLGWAHRILNKLEPTITWAVVEASCKPDDIAHRVALLGGVDVLALNGVADSVSPAAVLGLGIPVGRIGSTFATPAVWADLLLERLES
jgi:hypothetical protein